MLDEIDLARSTGSPLDELEEKLWRLLDSTDASFPPVLAGRVEDLVLKLRRADPDEDPTEIFQEVTSELSRYLG